MLVDPPVELELLDELEEEELLLDVLDDELLEDVDDEELELLDELDVTPPQAAADTFGPVISI